MFKLSCIFLLQALLAVNAEVIDINNYLDRVLPSTNNDLREVGLNIAPFPELKISPNVSYSEAAIIGVDSLVRTGDCWVDKQKNEVKENIHFGLGLLTIVFPYLTIDGQNMSGLVRIRNNSVHLALTAHYQNDECTITLDEFQVERLQDIEFQSSVAEYDCKNLENFFRLQVVPQVNGILLDLKPEIEAGLVDVVCSMLPNHHSTIEALLSQFISLN